MEKSFIVKLNSLIDKNKTLLCLGLDPDPNKLDLKNAASIKPSLIAWAARLIEKTKDMICCIKPNIAFYEQFGLEGLQALKEIIDKIPPEIPVILDAKRGDIGNTADAYARAVFEYWKVDAVTLSPYLGGDSIKPFLNYPGKMAFILCQTSNPSALQIQNHGNPFLYERIAEIAQTWGSQDQIGFVVGATQIDALSRVRFLAPNSWLLVPGVGAQGGDLDQAINAGLNNENSGMIIPISRSVVYAADAHETAQDYQNLIQLAISRRTSPSQISSNKSKLIEGLFSSGCIKFGNFILASGKESPVYIDLRRIISYPELFNQCVKEFSQIIGDLDFDILSAVPYAALPITAGIMQYLAKPMIYPRKEVKTHGTGQVIEGNFKPGQTAVLVEDVITTGGSILSAIETLKNEKLNVKDVVVLVDRLQGGRSALDDIGCNLRSILDIGEIINHLFSRHFIDIAMHTKLREYIQKG